MGQIKEGKDDYPNLKEKLDHFSDPAMFSARSRDRSPDHRKDYAGHSPRTRTNVRHPIG